MKIKCFLFGSILLLATGVLGAQEYWEIGSGLRLILSEVEDAAPSPLVFTPRVTAAFSLSNSILFRPALSYFATDYEWREGNEPPVIPCEHFVLASSYIHTVSIKSGFAFEGSWGEGRTYFAEVAPVFNIRFSQGSNGSVNELISAYFWEEVRFLSLALTGGASWTLNKKIVMGTQLGLEYPLANLWDTTSPAFLQGFAVEWGLFFRLPGKKRPEASSEEASSED